MKKPFNYPCKDCNVKIKNRTSNRQKLCKKCFIKRQMAGRNRLLKLKRRKELLKKNDKPNNSVTHKTEKKHWKTKKGDGKRFVNCKVCGKRFERNIKRKKSGGRTLNRPMNSITCSKICSRKWVYSDKRKTEDRSKK